MKSILTVLASFVLCLNLFGKDEGPVYSPNIVGFTFTDDTPKPNSEDLGFPKIEAIKTLEKFVVDLEHRSNTFFISKFNLEVPEKWEFRSFDVVRGDNIVLKLVDHEKKPVIRVIKKEAIERIVRAQAERMKPVPQGEFKLDKILIFDLNVEPKEKPRPRQFFDPRDTA